MVQCAAVKPDGLKCKSHAKARSKYCVSHKGWRPKGVAKKRLDSLSNARSMKEIRYRAKITPGGKGPIRKRAAAKALLGDARCNGMTSKKTQCKLLPRKGSKYCLTHKGGPAFPQ